MTIRELVKVLKKDGWKKIRQSGSHMIYEKNGITCPIPNHPGDIPPGTLANIRRITRVRL